MTRLHSFLRRRYTMLRCLRRFWPVRRTTPGDKTETATHSAVRPLALDTPAIANLPDECFARSEDGLTWKTLFSASKTPTNTFTCGIAKCAPTVGELKLHHHKSAELYHIMQGTGVVEIDGVEYSAGPGSVFFIPSNAGHRVRNTSDVEEFTWLFVFAVDDFGSVKYQWHPDYLG